MFHCRDGISLAINRICKVIFANAVYLLAVVFTDNEAKSKYRFSGSAESIL